LRDTARYHRGVSGVWWRPNVLRPSLRGIDPRRTPRPAGQAQGCIESDRIGLDAGGSRRRYAVTGSRYS